MMSFKPAISRHLFTLFLLWLTAVGGLRADVIETSDGTHLVGHVTKISDGKVYVDTAFAGPIVVRQSSIVRIATEKPVAVRLVGGERYDGALTTEQGIVRVATPAGAVETAVADIAASWKAGAPDPQSIRPVYRWVYQASVNVTGKSGTHSQFGGAYGITATLKRLKDTLALSSAYNRQTSDGVKSADQLKAGVDYSDNYSDRNSWYVRDVAGFDHIKDLSLYNTAAVGAGYDLVRHIHQTLTVRAGLAHRYEQYRDHVAPNVSTLALDLELNHSVQFASSLLTTKLAVVPAFGKFSNVNITQETDYDIPLAKSTWKIRLGVANNFISLPPAGIQKLDTTYFGSLVWAFERIDLGGVVRRVEWWRQRAEPPRPQSRPFPP